MKLKCDLIIQNLNNQQTTSQEKMHKSATIGLYRPKLDDYDNNDTFKSFDSVDKKTIIITIETKTFNLKYKLKRIETYTKFINEGKATLKLIDENIYLLISNIPSLTLINFLSFLNVKMAKSKIVGVKPINNKENNPISSKGSSSAVQVNSTTKYVNKLLSNVQCTLPKSALAVISPLCEQEVKDVMSLRKASATSKDSPITSRVRNPLNSISNKLNTTTPNANKTPKRLNKSKQSTPINKNKLVQLTDEQKYVLKAIKEGSNVFFTGAGGVGKSFLIQVIKKMLPNDSCFVTASTGVAASLIGGITLHAFSGLNVSDSGDSIVNTKNSNDADDADDEKADDRLQRIVDKILNSKDKLTNWKKCQHLIIDEISMIDSVFFDTLDSIARSIKNKDIPFGGIQIIVCGDFLQLPPVSKYGESKKKFCFQSRAWKESITVNIQLTKVKRQDDMEFVNMLDEIRFGKCSTRTKEILEMNKNKAFLNTQILPTKLCTHKDDVDFINKKELDSLTEKKQVYTSSDTTGNYSGNLKMLNMLCPAKQELVLKLNAQVMLIKNLDVGNNFVNGSRGCVIGFNENKLPIVKFLNGTEMTIGYETWTYNINKATGQSLTRKQIPLQLAWAISIHKSQGMTLDCVELSLSRVFEYGQAYVALSRAKSLKNLSILDFDVNAIKANETVIGFYQKLDFCNKKNRLNFD